MIVVRIAGGLGNQLFQLGLAFQLKEYSDKKVKLDLSFFEEQKHFVYKLYLKRKKIPLRAFEINHLPFDIIDSKEMGGIIFHNKKTRFNFLFDLAQKIYPLATRILPSRLIIKLISTNVIYEKKYDFNRINEDNRIYVGYWQDQSYFNNYELELKKNIDRVFIENKLYRDVQEFNIEETIVIHVRKGDYMHTNEYYNLEREYYENALHYIKTKYKTLHKILIISNDLNWCKKHMNFPGYEINFSSNKNPFYDFSILKSSKYIVCSNSTFCFWAAFLGQGEIITIPEMWYANQPFGFIPKSWKKINC